MNESAGAVEMERTCKKCGGADFREGGGRCWTCKQVRRRERYQEQIERYRAENNDKMRRYRAEKPSICRAIAKKARAKALEKNPLMDKQNYQKHRAKKLQSKAISYSSDLEASRRKSIVRCAAYDKRKTLRSMESANRKLKDIAMTKHLTFAQQAKSMTTQQLFTEFNTCTIRVSEGLYRMAVLWVELENRGENLSVIKTPFRQFFPDIASGRLLPEVVLEYGGAPKKLEIFSTLVAEDQRRLASEDAAVPLVVRTASGAAEVRTVNPHEMRLSEIRQVFGEGRIRTPSEQQRFVPATIAEQQPVAAPSLFNEEAFDLLAELTAQQRRDLSTLAFSRGMTPAEFVVDLLVRTKAVTKATSRATTESRATG